MYCFRKKGPTCAVSAEPLICALTRVAVQFVYTCRTVLTGRRFTFIYIWKHDRKQYIFNVRDFVSLLTRTRHNTSSPN